MYVGRKYTSPSTILFQLLIMVDQLEKVGEGPCTRALHVDRERKDINCNVKREKWLISWRRLEKDHIPDLCMWIGKGRIKNGMYYITTYGIYYSRTLTFLSCRLGKGRIKMECITVGSMEYITGKP